MKPIAFAPFVVLVAVLVAVMVFSGPVSMFTTTGLGVLALLGIAAVLVPVLTGLHQADSATDSS